MCRQLEREGQMGRGASFVYSYQEESGHSWSQETADLLSPKSCLKTVKHQ